MFVRKIQLCDVHFSVATDPVDGANRFTCVIGNLAPAFIGCRTGVRPDYVWIHVFDGNGVLVSA